MRQVLNEFTSIVLRRDRETCQRCGRRTRKVGVYVLTEPRQRFDKAKREYFTEPLTVGMCTTLCQECANATDLERAERDRKKEAVKQAKARAATAPLFSAEWYEQKGKRQLKCGVCGETGHNRRNCPRRDE